LPTRIKFDLLPANELPRSHTASFTKNWAKDLPDDKFLHEVVSRWRAQTYNPDSSSYSLTEQPAEASAIDILPLPTAVAPPLAPQLAKPTLRREGIMNQLAGETLSNPQNIDRVSPAILPVPPPITPVFPIATDQTKSEQPSLAALIKQFRT
jgi:uncharacterized protein